MNQNKIQRVEETFLNIFKIALIVILSVALIITVGYALKGVSEFMATPKQAEKAKEPEKLKIDLEDFLNYINPKEPEKKQELPAPTENDQPNSEKPKIESKSELDVLVDTYVLKLFTYLDPYQKACKVPIQVDQDSFMKSFPKNIIKGWFNAWGKDFADSQDNFMKMVLADPRVIELCRKNEGKGQIFTRSLDWHRDIFKNYILEKNKFINEEKLRISNFERQEEMRVSIEHAKAISTFTFAGGSFVIFMSLTLLLIFAKIESNLRGFNVNLKDKEII